MTVPSNIEVETTLLEVEFEDFGDGYHLQRFGLTLNAVWNLASFLHDDGSPPVQDGSPWEEPGVYLVGVTFNSPLKTLLQFRQMPRRVAEACVAVFKFLIFYDDERRQRQLSNDWLQEDVHAKRLANVEHALRIARSLSPSEKIDTKTVERVLELSRDLQHSRTTITGAEIVEET